MQFANYVHCAVQAQSWSMSPIEKQKCKVGFQVPTAVDMNVAPSIFPLEIFAVSFENCMEHTNALCGHNAEFSNIKACTSYDNCALKG
jgi:hypothetical protein